MKKILIADDEPKILKLTSNRLKKAGYEVVTAGDGEEALEVLLSEKPDLLICDLIMPKMNGYKVCHEVREKKEFDLMPIIVLSAWVREKHGENTAAADEYVTKPFNAEDLLAKVKELLENGRPKHRKNVT